MCKRKDLLVRQAPRPRFLPQPRRLNMRDGEASSSYDSAPWALIHTHRQKRAVGATIRHARRRGYSHKNPRFLLNAHVWPSDSSKE